MKRSHAGSVRACPHGNTGLMQIATSPAEKAGALSAAQSDLLDEGAPFSLRAGMLAQHNGQQKSDGQETHTSGGQGASLAPADD
jgi:hypothetical protein